MHDSHCFGVKNFQTFYLTLIVYENFGMVERLTDLSDLVYSCMKCGTIFE